MDAAVQTKQSSSTKVSPEIGEFFGNLYSFNNSLKLYHWHVTGKGSYAEHMALDQALESLTDVLDRIVETCYAMMGDIQITIPATSVPGNVIQHAEDFYKQVEYQRSLFDAKFVDSIIDDYQEATQQLLYRLKRLQ